MVQTFRNLKFSLVFLANLLFPFSQVYASEAPLPKNKQKQLYYFDNYTRCERSCELTEITPVSELSEIRPTDWVYTALQSLLDRYRISTNSKFNENSSLTRYEFAAVVNAAIESLNKQIVLNPQNLTIQQDFKILKRLQTEFATEIEDLQTRVELLEQRLPKDNGNFLPTTKFTGEAVFGIIGVENGANVNDTNSNNITFGSRVRLNLNTSFTGEDNLRIRLQGSNLPRLDRVTGTDMARLAFQGSGNNQVGISAVDYSFLISKDVKVFIPLIGGDLRDFTDPLNPYLSGSSRGAISRFGQRNPIYRQGGGSGLGISYEISDAVELEVGFVADDVDEPEVGFNKADYGAIAQLTLEPADDIEFGFTYIHSYNSISTGTGSARANDPFDENSEAIVANSFGLQSTIKLNANITVGGWLGYTQAKATDLPGNPTASIFNWALTLALPNLGSEGNVAGFVIGQPPKVTSNDFTADNSKYQDSDTSLHFEAFYRLQALEDIGVTFGVLMITNPEHNGNNDSIYVGTVRTTFRF